MKEKLKQLPNGDWTHDYWVDDEGNPIPEVITKDSKLSELWNAYQSQLHSFIEYNGKQYGNSTEDSASVDEVLWAISEGLFPESGMAWNTYLGVESVILQAIDFKGLKFARVSKKQELFSKYSGLEAQVKIAETQEELNAIVW